MSFWFGKFLDQDVTCTWDSLDLIFKIDKTSYWQSIDRFTRVVVWGLIVLGNTNSLKNNNKFIQSYSWTKRRRRHDRELQWNWAFCLCGFHTCRLQGVKRLQLHIINQRGGRSWALGKSHAGLQLGFIRVIQLCQCSLQDASILGWEMFTVAFHQGNTTPDRD